FTCGGTDNPFRRTADRHSDGRDRRTVDSEYCRHCGDAVLSRSHAPPSHPRVETRQIDRRKLNQNSMGGSVETTTFINPKKGTSVLLVGTMKGAFLLSSDANREQWEVSGPHFPGRIVYSLAYDRRAGRQRLWAGSSNFFGMMLHSSDDFGRTWTNPESSPIKFPEDTGQALKQIWQIATGREQEPDKMYCGVEPAALFVSNDGGETWSLARGLFNHPHRPQWQPGGGGLCLHTIILDPNNPKRTLVAVSAAGVYRTDNGGDSWQARNQGLTAEFLPNKYPEFGQCVHKIDRHPSRPERLYLQNHGGLFRSDDAGDS